MQTQFITTCLYLNLRPTDMESTLSLCYQDVIVGVDKYNYSLKTASQYCQHHSVISVKLRQRLLMCLYDICCLCQPSRSRVSSDEM